MDDLDSFREKLEANLVTLNKFEGLESDLIQQHGNLRAQFSEYRDAIESANLSEKDKKDQFSQYDELLKKLHKLVLEAKALARKRTEQMTRDELFKVSQERQRSLKPQSPEDKIGDEVTKSLKRMLETMRGEVERSSTNISTAKSTTKVLKGTTDNYENLSGTLDESRGLIRDLWRKNRMDMIYIFGALGIFIATAVYVILQRTPGVVWLPGKVLIRNLGNLIPKSVEKFAEVAESILSDSDNDEPSKMFIDTIERDSTSETNLDEFGSDELLKKEIVDSETSVTDSQDAPNINSSETTGNTSSNPLENESLTNSDSTKDNKASSEPLNKAIDASEKIEAIEPESIEKTSNLNILDVIEDDASAKVNPENVSFKPVDYIKDDTRDESQKDKKPLDTVATASTLKVENDYIVDFFNGDVRSSSVSIQFTEASDRAWSAFQALKSEKTPESGDFLATLRQLSEARDFPRCVALFEEIKTAGIALDSEMFSLIFNAARRTLSSNEIDELFGDGQINHNKENSHQQEYSHSIFFDQILGLMNEMKSLNLRLNVWFYEELANFLTANNQADVMTNLSIGMDRRGEYPSAKFYNRMLHCFSQCGIPYGASILFKRLVTKGPANYYTYLVRANSLVYVNEMEDARAVLSDMKSEFPMDVVAYNILIKSYLSQGNCEQAIQVFKQMTSDQSIVPNRVTCRTFLSHFYETANSTHSELIVSYFERANFPETFEDFGNVIKFFARYDPPKVNEIYNQVKDKITSETPSSDKNQIFHAFLKVLNDPKVTNDWKKSFANLVLEGENPDASSIKSSTLNDPELPYHFRTIIDKIESPDSVTYKIVLKKLIQLGRYDSVKALYQSMLSPENSHNVSAQPIHTNFYLTAILMMSDIQGARDFIADMHGRNIPISRKNTGLLEKAGIELPRPTFPIKKKQVVTENRYY